MALFENMSSTLVEICGNLMLCLIIHGTQMTMLHSLKMATLMCTSIADVAYIVPCEDSLRLNSLIGIEMKSIALIDWALWAVLFSSV